MNNISFFFMEGGGGRETVYMYLRHVNLKFFYRATGLQLHVQQCNLSLATFTNYFSSIFFIGKQNSKLKKYSPF